MKRKKNKKKIYLVYLISHPNSKHFYIGKTNDLKVRTNKHLEDSIRKNKTFIHQWLQKYPEPVIEILEENIDEETAFLYERMYISLFRSWNLSLMNMTNGGDGASGYRHTDETKAKISKIHKGLVYSEESRKLMSEKRKGEKHWLYGKHFTEEHKLNASMSHTKIHRKVNVYDMNGNFIKQCDTPSKALREIIPEYKQSTGDILTNCRRFQLSCGGYIFQFSDDDKIEEILQRLKTSPVHKQQKIYQYALNDEFINEYENSYQAEKALKEQGINARSSDIRSCCKGKQKTCRGFKFKYAE